MDTQIEKLADVETDASAMNNKQTYDSDVSVLNDQAAGQLDQDVDDTSVEEDEAEEDDAFLDDDASTQTNPDSDGLDFLDTTDTTFATDDDTTGLGPDTNEVNFLGEDMEASILDSAARIDLDNTDETQENAVGDDDDLQQQQQQQQEDDDDETVEKTWDMDGDDVDDDQENSSVDALLDAGEDSFNDNNIDNVINDDTFVVDELVDTKSYHESPPTTTTGGDNDDDQHHWNNENGELARGGAGESNLQQEDGQQAWNEEDDTEAEAEEEQEETMEQGTVEENENDRLGATLEHALDALEVEQDTSSSSSSSSSPPSPMIGNDVVVDDSNHANGLYDIKGDTSLPVGEITPLVPPHQQQEQATPLGPDSADDLASVDTSLILLIAVFILLCLRLPYVKRFFVKLFKTQEPTTLPYHTTHSKELD